MVPRPYPALIQTWRMIIPSDGVISCSEDETCRANPMGRRPSTYKGLQIQHVRPSSPDRSRPEAHLPCQGNRITCERTLFLCCGLLLAEQVQDDRQGDQAHKAVLAQGCQKTREVLDDPAKEGDGIAEQDL